MKKILLSSSFKLALAAVICFAALSPKWNFWPAAWGAPFFLIMLLRRLKPGKSFLFGFIVLLAASLIANYKVMPFPVFST